MAINEMLRKNGMSLYRLSERSGIPYSTLREIAEGKRDLRRCTADTVFKLSRALGVSMDSLMESVHLDSSEFEHYCGSVKCRIEEGGDRLFIAEVLGSGEIRRLVEEKKLEECFYLLETLDDLCRKNGLRLFEEFNDLRALRKKKSENS
ncbi:MAG: helix-turn-helix transcriptional regulator [Clostridia bacterium]|nr:helix-turn-helix transcriptional regulator [Clostridia bacterium]